MRLRPWLKKQEAERQRRITAEVQEAREGYDFNVGDAEHKKFERESFADHVAQIHRRHPRLRLRPRTWIWWFRWALALLIFYGGTSYVAYGLRHSEAPYIDTFADIWRALTWR